MASLTIDFFHDVVCCWCFNISSRMRDLAAEFDLDIRHRTFVLQANPAEMTARWGTPKDARETILGHWAVCRQVSDRPDLVDIDAMRAAPFDYPHGRIAGAWVQSGGAARRTGCPLGHVRLPPAGASDRGAQHRRACDGASRRAGTGLRGGSPCRGLRRPGNRASRRSRQATCPLTSSSFHPHPHCSRDRRTPRQRTARGSGRAAACRPPPGRLKGITHDTLVTQQWCPAPPTPPARRAA